MISTMISNELKKRIIELDKQADPFKMDILIDLIDVFLEELGHQDMQTTPPENIDYNTRTKIVAVELKNIRDEIQQIRRHTL